MAGAWLTGCEGFEFVFISLGEQFLRDRVVNTTPDFKLGRASN